MNKRFSGMMSGEILSRPSIAPVATRVPTPQEAAARVVFAMAADVDFHVALYACGGAQQQTPAHA